jgi:hypothetical protein
MTLQQNDVEARAFRGPRHIRAFIAGVSSISDLRLCPRWAYDPGGGHLSHCVNGPAA